MFKKRESHTISIDDYEKVFRKYYGSLCLYATSLLGNMEEAEEVVQDLFVRLWEKREKLNIQTDLRSYLVRAVRNNSYHYGRKNHKIRHLEVEDFKTIADPDRHDFSSEESVETIRKTLEKTLQQFPERWQQIFYMIRFEENKYRETAEKLGISVKTVEKAMSKMMKALHESNISVNYENHR